MHRRIHLVGEKQRAFAIAQVRSAPDNTVVHFNNPQRTLPQNAKFWAMLKDIAVAAPDGRRHDPDTWKALMMHACNHVVVFETGLNGEPFPTGFRSSKLTVAQMADLITCAQEYGDRHGIKWSDPTIGAPL